MSEALTNTDRYQELCEKINLWWSDRRKVGEYLREIQEKRLYKHEYTSLEAFCEAKFGISRSSVYRLIDTVTVSAAVGMPVNGRQAQALREMPEEIRSEVAEEVASTGDMTAERIREAGARRAEGERGLRVDKTGYRIPNEIVHDYDRAAETGKTLTRLVNELRNEIKRGIDLQDIVFKEVTNTTLADLQNAFTALKCILPHAVCPTCAGRNPARCRLCSSRGWVSKFIWETAVPEETRRMRGE